MANSDYVQVRISPDLKKKLKAQAEKENRTLSNYILCCIAEDLERKAKNQK